MDILTITREFDTQEKCIKHLEEKRWGDMVYCPYCGSVETRERKGEHRHHCRDCNNAFSVTVGTIFHDSKLPLQTWFIAIALVLNAKKGISSRQLARDLGVNKDTAWRMQMQIREAMKDQGELLSGIIEMDETYIGGKPRKSNNRKSDSNNPRGRGTSKTPVVGMVERDGKVKATVKSKNELRFKDMHEIIKDNVDIENSTLITDEYGAYNPLKKILDLIRINHQHSYVDGNIHTNTIEGFWALIKRGIIGQYHKVSLDHLHKYINEFCFKYNNRNNQDLFSCFLNRAVACL